METLKASHIWLVSVFFGNVEQWSVADTCAQEFCFKILDNIKSIGLGPFFKFFLRGVFVSIRILFTFLAEEIEAVLVCFVHIGL